MKRASWILFLLLFSRCAYTQSAEGLLQQVRQKLELVNDYEAKGKLRTNLLFIKAPIVSVQIFYKKPNKFKIINENGFSFIPKSMVNLNLNKFFSSVGDYELLDGGIEAGTNLRVIKLLPIDENSEWVLSVLFINEKNKLVYKIRNTTRESGTYELQLTYGNFIEFGLPDKIAFSFNTKAYKLPKGMTWDYDIGNDKVKNSGVPKKGNVEILFSTYKINKGIADAVFEN